MLPARQELLGVRPRNPVVPQLLDVRRRRPNLIALGLQQLKDAYQHGVVLELTLLHDPLLERQEHVFVVESGLASRGELHGRAPRRRADSDGRIRATFDVLWLSGWAPHQSQQQPLRPGSAKTRLADALGVSERSAGEKASR